MTTGKKALCTFCDWRGSIEKYEENDKTCPECDSMHDVRILNAY